LVLVASPARVCARRSADWPICHVLRSVSPRDGHRRLSRDAHDRAARSGVYEDDVQRRDQIALRHGEAGSDHRGRRRELTRNGVHYPPSASPLLPRKINDKAAERRPVTSYSNAEKIWSGRRGSNPRPRPWQGRALPLSYTRIRKIGDDGSPTTGRAMPNAARECNSRRSSEQAPSSGVPPPNWRKSGRVGFRRLQIRLSSAN
jgi:hypothetical protein